MFSKDPEKRKIQVEAALKNSKLSEKGRQTLLKMKKELEDIPTSSKKSSNKKSTKKATKPENQYGVKKGDIFYNSYGYDATYYNFYEVTDILGKSKIKVRELSKGQGKSDGYGPNGWTVRPLKGVYNGDEKEKVVKKSKWMKDDGTKEDLYIGADYNRRAYYIDSKKAINKDWHEDNYH